MVGDLWEAEVDLVAVERAASMRGKCPPLTEKEKQSAARQMRAAGVSASTTALRLSVAKRTVERWGREQ